MRYNPWVDICVFIVFCFSFFYTTRLKIVRIFKGLSQADFAKNIGIGQSTYSEIESGKRGLPDPVRIAIESQYMICSEWLCSGEGEMCIHEQEHLHNKQPLPPDVQEMVDFYMQFAPEVRKRMIEEDKERRIEALRKKKQG